MLAREGIEPILQLTCRDRNRIALQGDLMGAAASGVNNLLLLTGDDPKAGDQPETKPVFDVDSTTLTAMARDLRDKGELPSGRKVGGPGELLSRRRRLADRSAARLEAGQARRQDRRRRRVRADPVLHGCRHRAALCRRAWPSTRRRATLFLLIGIAPLRSAKSARWMKQHLFGTIIPDALIERLERAADPAAEGPRIAIELVEELATIPASPASMSWRRRTRRRCPR